MVRALLYTQGESDGPDSHMPKSHLDAPYYISLVIIHLKKYDKTRLNESMAHG
jgi:hypothetical protein